MASETTRVVRRTAASLSYEELKHEQEKAVVSFVEGRVFVTADWSCSASDYCCTYLTC